MFGGADFIIYDVENRLLTAGDSFFYEPWVSEIELETMWMDILRIHIENNFSIVIGWIQDRFEQHHVHPLLHDI